MKLGRLIISRTDNLGDVVLTLPLAGALKHHSPGLQVLFLGKSYTKAVIDQSEFVDEFIDWNEIKHELNPLKSYKADAIIHVFPVPEIARAAKAARINQRIGTSHRSYHWWTCNTLVNLGRRRSNLHESQLNLRLLGPLMMRTDFSLEEIPRLYGWKTDDKSVLFNDIIDNDKINLIFHMKSKGSTKEWSLKNYCTLAQNLGPNYSIILTGTKEEGQFVRSECPEIFELENTLDTYGLFDLENFIALIGSCDGILACSTGPLHIAAAAGIYALGLYPAKRPMHAGRWCPIGLKAEYLEEEKNEEHKLLNISVSYVLDALLKSDAVK